MADIATLDPNEQGQVKQNFVIRQLAERHMGLASSVDSLSSSLSSLTSTVNSLSSTVSSLSTTVTALSGKPFAASVSRNGSASATYIPPSPNKYYLFPATAVDFNQSSLWANTGNSVASAFIPPNGTALILLTASVLVTGGVASSGNMVAKWIKNGAVDGSNFLTSGTDVRALIGGASGETNGSAIMTAACIDVPSNNDYYNLFVFIDSTSLGVATVTIDANVAHTWAQCTVLR